MKTNWLVGSVFLAGAMVLQAQTNDLGGVLRQGLFEEEANRNLDAAISNYQALATQFDQNRRIAATAIFRLGECYRKLGQTNDAVVQYQRILREFSDQEALATLSRQNLTGLGVASQPRFQQGLQAIITKNPPDSVAPTTAESAARAAELEADAAALKEQITHLASLNREDRRIAVQQNFSNPVLTKLMQDLTDAEQKFAGLTNDYAPTDLHIARVTAQLDAINVQIDAQVNGVIGGLQAKMEADLNTAKALRDQTGPVEAAHAEGTTLSDEFQEIRRIEQLIQNSPDLINAERGDAAPLYAAAGKGQLSVAAFLLDHGANIEGVDNHVPLLAAARNGNRAMVELLLSRGADVNAKESDGYTALHLAAGRGFQAVAEVLLANHADVNILTAGGSTPLFSAASSGQLKIIQMLLAAGANTNLKDVKGRSPLNYAIGNTPEIFQALLDAGTNPNTEDSEGRTPLSYAAERDSSKVVRLLLAAKANPNAGKLDVPLLCAIHKQDTASAELLLADGANPNLKGGMDWPVNLGVQEYSGANSQDRPGLTPLYLAVSTGQLPMVNLLLKFKADPNDSQTDGMSLLFSALTKPDILEALLAAGGNVDSHLSEGKTLLDQAVNGNYPQVAVDILLKHGADPNARDSRGYTPLNYAVWGQANTNKIELLLDHHADPNVRGENGQTPLDYLKSQVQSSIDPASKAGFTKIADLLRSHGALDNLPHWDRIMASRPSANYSQTVFQKGTNDWNRFTLLETLLNFYAEQSFHQPRFGGNPEPEISLPFPDLTRVTIIRHQQNTTNEMRLKVDLLNSTNGIDCSRDVPLEFGDVVDIPEREHALGDQPIGLTDSQRDAIVNGLKGSVRLEVRGGNVELPVFPTDSSLIGYVLNRPEAQAVLLSSSDLSRVKVTRADPVTGKKREWILDCSHLSKNSNPQVFPPGQNGDPHYSAPDFRLRAGDVIEVPEK